MPDRCCDQIVGGHVYVVLGDMRFDVAGETILRPGGSEREAFASSGGRMYGIERAVLTEAEITFLNACDADPDLIWNARCKAQVTIVEDSRGYRHMFTDAMIVGRPEKNLQTGEVTGMRITTDRYQRVGGESTDGPTAIT
jgi:hypothetical protein